jgi:hypothetical protein
MKSSRRGVNFFSRLGHCPSFQSYIGHHSLKFKTKKGKYTILDISVDETLLDGPADFRHYQKILLKLRNFRKLPKLFHHTRKKNGEADAPL